VSRALDTLRKIEAESDLTPMIDVTFLLLIFFIVTVKFKTSEGQIQAFLPKDRGLNTSSPKAVTEQRVKLLWYDPHSDKPTKGKHGRCVLKVGKKRFANVGYAGDVCYYPKCGENHGSPDFAALRDYLAQAKLTYPKERGGKHGMPVIIDARSQVQFKYVVRALNACLQAGIQDVTFAAAEDAY